MKLTTVSRIEAGYYKVSDGRTILKQGQSWYVISSEGKNELGPLSTLNAAKQYVSSGSVPLGQHNLGSSHGRRQSKKEFNSYLASEAQNGNPGPAILWVVILFVICGLLVAVRGH
ncbi:hypothetical protein BCU98_03540 [Vibrio splendidus]|uniref:hypothetical protein n=1 Tax=Vibrio splendidus TaxID=29497 RepID=UPI000C848817|nr:MULTISPECIES: hypothetical protein [Vibrio]MCZ8502216.1 hypothetical protein [Vibrio lentus]PMG11909.1 hypothetical protein BCU98_03540 [Vibrio splendidus]PMH61110.1 hypothetical protein BCU64_15330 [Vibrio lentus]